MPQKTNIEWTDYTSNPIVPREGGWGCTKVSPGCDHCYAEVINKRFGNKRPFEGRWEFVLKDKELADLTKLPAGSKVFLGDMTDIFHSDVPWEILVRVFNLMAATPQHIYQILTKRPGRMAYFANKVLPEWNNCHATGPWDWPPNVWAGTSVESQKYVPRLECLARVPARVRFVSVEPMLGLVDLRKWLGMCYAGCPDNLECPTCGNESILSWVIAGGESGPGARPMHPGWVRGLRDECEAAGVPFFFKQWGQWAPCTTAHDTGWAATAPEKRWMYERLLSPGNRYAGRPSSVKKHTFEDGLVVYKIGKKAAGALLDGREWQEMPGSASGS